MRQIRTTRLHRSIRVRPILDLLEGRIVLSTMTDFGLESDPTLSLYMAMPSHESLSPISVDPASGSTITRTPETLSVTFDRPIDPWSYFLDLRLSVKQDDNSWAPLNGDGLPIELQLDETGTVLSAPFGALGNGEYQLYLSGDSMLAGLDGSFLSTGFQDFILSEFTIGAAGAGLDNSTDLGTIDSTVLNVEGSLDFAENPTDVRLYKIELGEGHFWRLGLEVSTVDDEDLLHTGLSLFDAEGRPVATASTGRPGSPSNPYLYQGLAAGTYYVGVSGRSNLPGATGAYDPATGAPGVPTLDEPGGAFLLQLVADAADTPTAVKTLFLDYADPNSAMPSGFTVQFAGAISSRSLVGHSKDAVVVRDHHGRTWPVQITEYSEASSSLTFLFDQPLPRGDFTVLVAEGRLTDLAGLTPTVPGESVGTLGSFQIETTPEALLQKDFGTLLPGGADEGVFRALGLGQDSTTDIRVVLTVEGFYKFDLNYDGVLTSATLIGEDGETYSIDLSPSGSRVTTLLQLEPGVYHLSLVTPPGRAAIVEASIRYTLTPADSLLDNGVGSGPGLGLRLIDPLALSPSPTPREAPGSLELPSVQFLSLGIEALQLPEPGETSPGEPNHSSNEVVANPSTPGIGSLYFAAATTTTLGNPSTGSNSVGAVGPSTNGTSVAIASNEKGLPRGLAVGFGESIGRLGNLSDEPASESDDVGSSVARATNGQLVELADTADAAVDTAIDGLVRDGAVVDKAIEIQPLALVFNRAWVGRNDPTGNVDASLVPSTAEVIVDAEPAAEESAPPIERADVSSSLGVGLIAVAAAHYQRRVGKWVSKIRQYYQPRLRVHGGTPTPVGPHRHPRG